MSDGQDVLAELLRASRKCWRISDGRGTHASGTASGAATRRDQVLLAVPGESGAPAAVLLRFDDRAQTAAGTFELTPAFAASGAAAAPGSIALVARAGALPMIASFTCEPWPTWRLRGDGFLIERSLRMVEGHAALLATWRLIEGENVRVVVAPLLAARELRALQRESPEFRGVAQGIPGRVRFETRQGFPSVSLWHTGAFVPARTWQRGLAYPLDVFDAGDPDARRAPSAEDAYVPGWVQATLAAPDATLHVAVSIEEHLFRSLASEQRLGAPPARTIADCFAVLDDDARRVRAMWRHATARGADFTARQAAAAHGGEGEATARRHEALVPQDDPVVAPLADALLEARLERPGRAGAVGHWASGVERGADTLRVAAALVSLRAMEPARAIARGFLEYLDEGLAPESFAPDGSPRYGDPEASLWLVHVVDLLVRRASVAAEASAFLRDTAWPALEGVAQHLRSGSRHGVHCDREGFLWSGEGERALARADHNALWYHALVAMAQLARLVGRREHGAFYLAWAHELQRGYAERFWDETCGCLFAALTPEGPVRGVSPSQLWAAALSPMLLAPERAQRLVATVERELLAREGLRDSPGGSGDDPAWLGVWATATLRAHARSPEAIARVRERYAMLARTLEERGAAALSPVAAAELLLAWVEEIDHAASVPALS